MHSKSRIPLDLRLAAAIAALTAAAAIGGSTKRF
jgi:hypothetical protein